MPISVIAGLGNPGSRYSDTRHNIGFMAVEALAKRVGAPWKLDSRLESEAASIQVGRCETLLLKPQTWMNESGRALQAAMRWRKLPPESLMAVYDEIQLPLCQIKLGMGGGDGGHNGAADIIQRIGGRFWRFRIGVGPRTPPQIDMKDFVLGKFRQDERDALEKKIGEIATGLERVIDIGPDLAMNQLNQRNEEATDERPDS